MPGFLGPGRKKTQDNIKGQANTSDVWICFDLGSLACSGCRVSVLPGCEWVSYWLFVRKRCDGGSHQCGEEKLVAFLR